MCRAANPRLRIRRARFSALIPRDIHQATPPPTLLHLLHAGAKLGSAREGASRDTAAATSLAAAAAAAATVEVVDSRW